MISKELKRGIVAMGFAVGVTGCDQFQGDPVVEAANPMEGSNSGPAIMLPPASTPESNLSLPIISPTPVRFGSEPAERSLIPNPEIADRFIFPIDGYVTGWNYMEEYINSDDTTLKHLGIDLNWFDRNQEVVTGWEDFGMAVKNIGNGVVVFAEETQGDLGNIVIVEHTINVMGEEKKVYSLLAHLDQIYAQTGNYYQIGEILGTVGNSGWADYPHLHFELFDQNHWQNFVSRYGPGYPFGELNEEYLRIVYYDPSSFINFRNSSNSQKP